MRKNRTSYGEPIYWTLEKLQEVLFKLSFDKVPGKSMVLLDGCDCCSSLDEGGVSVRDSDFDGKVVIIRRKAGFEDPEEEEGLCIKCQREFELNDEGFCFECWCVTHDLKDPWKDTGE